MAILRMINPVQHYDWGSTTMLARLRDGAAGRSGDEKRSDAGQPDAEVWMGTHARGPSRVVFPDGSVGDLRAYLEEDPEARLGPEARALMAPGEERPGFPFLFKILTAEHGLSIQSHPSREMASAGFDREEAQGIDIAARHRNYRDRNHKPELICAVEPFWGLRGFRPFDELCDEAAAFMPFVTTQEALHGVHRALRSFVDRPDAERWKDAFMALLEAGSAQTPRSRAALADAAQRYAASRLDDATASGADAPSADSAVGDDAARRDDRYWWVDQLLTLFPGDPGAMAPLYLNLVHLQPGQAMYLPAGVLHAYLYGAGIEIMANSDNVLRAGCTSKHVDTGELGRSLSFEAETPVILDPHGENAADRSIFRYETGAQEFELTRVRIANAGGGARSHGDPTDDTGAGTRYHVHKRCGPAVVLAIGGEVQVAAERTGTSGASVEDVVRLEPTESAVVDHGTSRFFVVGDDDATVFLAAVPGAVRVP